jgi:hypothetical protein
MLTRAAVFAPNELPAQFERNAEILDFLERMGGASAGALRASSARSDGKMRLASLQN